jgi:integrase
VEIKRVWEAVRHAAGLGGVRLHDLRHSFASVGASGGLSLPMIAALLGHHEVSTTQRYAHLADDPRKAAADRVAAQVAAMLAGGDARLALAVEKAG